MCRRNTTGIVELNFENNNKHFEIFNVGGARNERKKWIFCFENLNFVIYMVALSDYNELCYEDNFTNKLQESLDLWDEIVNSHFFKDKKIFLFFNKVDEFDEEINNSGIGLDFCFKDFVSKNLKILKNFEKYRKNFNFDIFFNFDKNYENFNFKNYSETKLTFPLFAKFLNHLDEKKFIEKKFLSVVCENKERIEIIYLNTLNKNETIKVVEKVFFSFRDHEKSFRKLKKK